MKDTPLATDDEPVQIAADAGYTGRQANAADRTGPQQDAARVVPASVSLAGALAEQSLVGQSVDPGTSNGGQAEGEHGDEATAESIPRPGRKRPQRGERRMQILQTLAEMLESPNADRVTTAALAARIQVSEAALYRHFASKAQMFEGLIDFIEQTLFGLINQITAQEEDALLQLQAILALLLSFAERNPGMTRVLIGDALVTENARLQARVNQLVDRLEVSLKQCFRTAVAQQRLPEQTDAAGRANLLLSCVLGRWLRFAKGGFKRVPTEGLEAQVLLLIT